jgi:hypothetical protein
MILYLKFSKDSTKKLLGLISTFGKVEGYKINIQKSVAFLYVNRPRKKSGKESILNSLKKYLGINLTKEVKDLYNENY